MKSELIFGFNFRIPIADLKPIILTLISVGSEIFCYYLIMYKAVIFDFFGVFCPDITMEWFKKTVLDWQDKKDAFQSICTRSDYGKLSRNNFNIELAGLAGVSVQSLMDGVEKETVINNSLVEYVNDLKAKGLKVACLSNGTHEWTLRVIQDHGLGELFETVVLSGDLGIVKPDPAIYTHALEELGVEASEAVFVDDRQVNVYAGESCGMKSVLFTTTSDFINSFEKLTNSNLFKIT